jgi:uncharacterized protein YyaL (SSP411 family)
VNYILRDMTHPEGGFYSAEDADSEGQEGKFYCWTQSELKNLLTEEEFKVATRYYGITKQGNFIDHSHPSPLPHLNVLSLVSSLVTPEDGVLLQSARGKMRQVREQRVRPHLDDKILTSWNGLMLGALAQASVVLDDAHALPAAEKNLAFLKTHLWNAKNKTLHHRWRDGERDTVQLLDDYAFLLEGVLHLYEATLDPGHLEFAIELAREMLSRFEDSDQGGFWQAVDSPQLILRVKEDYDGAEPSGNSVAAQGLLRLATMTGDPTFRAAGWSTLQGFQNRLQRMPQALPRMLQAVDFALQEPHRVVISGRPDSPEARALLRTVHSIYQPHKVVLGTVGPVEPFVRTLASNEAAQVYLCTGTECQAPEDDPSRLAERLKASC